MAGCVRLLSSIQPTLARAFMMMAPAFVAREPEAVEHACVARGRAAGLLDPAMQIIGGASGVLDAKTPRHGPRKAAGTILAVG